MDSQRFRVLKARQRAVIAVAVLLDGREAATYLESDSINGKSLARAASEIGSFDPELRMPLVGSLLRAAIKELER